MFCFCLICFLFCWFMGEEIPRDGEKKLDFLTLLTLIYNNKKQIKRIEKTRFNKIHFLKMT